MKTIRLPSCLLPFVLAMAAGLPAQDVGSTPAAAPAVVADLEAAFARALPVPVEARWTLVPWRRSLTAALAEAKAAGKAVYLLVNDGEVDSGRC